MPEKYYVIAKVDKSDPQQPHSSEWPKLIAYSFNSQKILMSEGRGHGLMGGSIALSKFQPDVWKEIFIDTNSEWFLDLYLDGTLINCQDEDTLKGIISSRRPIEIIEC